MSELFNKLAAITVVAALAAIAPTTAHAQSIGINFSAGVHTLAPAAQPGVVGGANWNNISGGSGTSLALLNDSGAASGALLTFNSTGAFSGLSTPATANAATNTLYQAGIFGDPNTREVSISVTNIPFAVYTVYVFADGDNTPTNTLSMTDGISTFYYRSAGQSDAGAPALLQTTSTNPAAPTAGQAQYQVFTNKTGSTLTLTAGGSVNNVIANAVRGVHIVNAVVVPEAGTLALLLPALGVVCGAFIVRRRSGK